MSEKTETNKQKVPITITTIATLLGILVSVFYAFGYIYDQGYLSQYGLSTEYFTRSHSDYIFKFFYIILLLVTGTFSFSAENILYILLFVLVIAITYFLYLQNSKKDRRIPGKLKEVINIIKANDTLFNAIKSSILFTFIVSAGFFVMYFILSWLIILWSPLRIGQNDAQKEIDRFTECTEGKVNSYPCAYIYREKTLVLSGALIAKSDKYVAIWNGKKAVVYPLKNEVIVIEKARKSTKEKT